VVRGRCAVAAFLLGTLAACQGAHLPAANAPAPAAPRSSTAGRVGAGPPATQGLSLLGQRFPGEAREAAPAAPQRRPVLSQAELRALTRAMEARKRGRKGPPRVPTAAERARDAGECFAGGNVDNPLRNACPPNLLAPLTPLLNRAIREAVK
jgi:hypothetical protein